MGTTTSSSRRSVIPWSHYYAIFFLCFLLLLDEICLAQQQEDDEDAVVDYNTLANWVRDHDGIVDGRITLSTINNNNNDENHDESQSHRGMIAMEDLPENTTLVGIPFDLILKYPTEHQCDILKVIEREIRLGTSSFWYPYLALLLQQLNNDNSIEALSCRIPSLWNSVALDHLHHHVFPPGMDDSTRHLRWAQEFCGYPIKEYVRNNKGDEMEEIIDPIRLQSLVIKITRACEHGLVPIYDLFNHHNGELNLRLAVHDEQQMFQVVSARFIPKGSELFLSYGAKWVPQMFQDYGFIESWPQIFHWYEISPSSEEDGTMHQFVHAFMMLPAPSLEEKNAAEGHDDVHDDMITVAVDPSRQLADHVGRQYKSLVEYREMVRIHNMFVLENDKLVEFYHASRKLLNSVTSIPDDEKYLKLVHHTMTTATTASDGLFWKDIICAVEYRLEFKRAVLKASRAVETILAIRERSFRTSEL